MYRQWFTYVPVILFSDGKKFIDEKVKFNDGIKFVDSVARFSNVDYKDKSSDRRVLAFIEADNKTACDYLIDGQSVYLSITKISYEEAASLAKRMQPSNEALNITELDISVY